MEYQTQLVIMSHAIFVSTKFSQISKESIDSAELQQNFNKLSKKAFPYINLQVYVRDEQHAADELNQRFHIGGTTLNIEITRTKE